MPGLVAEVVIRQALRDARATSDFHHLELAVPLDQGLACGLD
jgi:hypothetical protein